MSEGVGHDHEHEGGTGAASASQAGAGATASLGAIASQLDNILQSISKGDVDSKTIDTLKNLAQSTTRFVDSKQATDYMGEEVAGAMTLDDAMVGKTNRKIILDDAYFDLSYARKQLLRHNDMAIANANNQYGQNNAMTLNGVDKLQNDLEDSVKIGAVLDRLAADVIALKGIVTDKP